MLYQLSYARAARVYRPRPGVETPSRPTARGARRPTPAYATLAGSRSSSGA